MTSRRRSAKSKVTSSESAATPSRLSASGRSSERRRRICYEPEATQVAGGAICVTIPALRCLTRCDPRGGEQRRASPPAPACPWRRPPPRTVGGRDGGRCPPSVARLGRAPSGGGGRHTEFGRSVSGLRKARQQPNSAACILARNAVLDIAKIGGRGGRPQGDRQFAPAGDAPARLGRRAERRRDRP